MFLISKHFKVFNNKLTNKDKSQLYEIGNTPDKLIEAGIPENNLAIGYKIIEKAYNQKNTDHNLNEATIGNVYEALHNPIVIIKAGQNANEKKANNRYSAIVEVTTNENEKQYLLVAIETDKNSGKGNVVNDIRSIHSREDFSPMIENAIEENRLLKVNKLKIKDLLWGNNPDSISGGDRASLLEEKILQYDNNVNKILYQPCYQNASPRGLIRLNPKTQEAMITVFKDKQNLSTVLHETGHYFLNNLSAAYQMENAPQWVRDSFETLAKEMGFDPKEPLSTETHERFARLAEAYFREGYTAPY